MPRSAIEVHDVAKRFRLIHERNTTLKATILNGFRRTVHEDFWALDGVSFTVDEGTTYGVIGHNGSGKSTLLKCLSRIYRPDRGSITARGRVSALLELGAGFHPELSGRENVYLNGSILGMSTREIRRRFDDIVAFAGLEQFIDTPVKNYSSGMYVRLGFSIAITVEPDILLVDEVLAVGDESFQQRCLEKFAELRHGGRTVLVVTHSLDTVRNMCDRAAWLDHGHLMAEGTAGDVVTRYLESVREDRRAAEQDEEGLRASTDYANGGWAISAVRLLGNSAKPVDLVTSGEPITIQVELDAPTAGSAMLAIGIYRTDGVHVAGPIHRLLVPRPGAHMVNYRVPRVPLAEGVYDITTKLLDEHGQQTYAVRHRAARLDVVKAHDDATGGVVDLAGDWQIVDGVVSPRQDG